MKNINDMISSIKMNERKRTAMYKVTLAAARVNAGMKQTDVAREIGVVKETVSNWERGKTSPTATTLLRLCELYKAPLDAIILPS